MSRLAPLGFTGENLRFGDTDNLWARKGSEGPVLAFAGHTDVVPTGPEAQWQYPPFKPTIVDGMLYGRGATDMKGAVACFTAAASRFLARRGHDFASSISLLITGDEEGPALHGTKRVVEQLIAEGERIDACVVGEPSSSQRLGDMIKVGRRGSLNSWITVRGRQGHVAYPDRAANPVPVLVRLLNRLAEAHLDDGYPEFPPSNLEITTVDVGNPASNVIPAEATARLNIRFNPTHTGDALSKWLDDQSAEVASESGLTITLEHLCSGDAFLTDRGPLVEAVEAAVEGVEGIRPECSTTGGTSDARFIRALCPVLELGLVGQTMHQIDEQVPVNQLESLTEIYAAVIRTWFARTA